MQLFQLLNELTCINIVCYNIICVNISCTDVAVCRNADEILEIHQEMVDLSRCSNTVCTQTKYISVDNHSRCALNDLPVIICRPEENLSPRSATVSYDISAVGLVSIL